ncbi:zinc-dependent metalloprotease [Mycolicibacterium diernhoferi]|uniref:Hydrolase n=1 Tax=Mycolicibacterium diernhoferi TaxID=1801 RepID=A0A1Q4HE33_9MYCO|nr:zinc-dependent metalloprotease [Mycolicibacterium diernhoferi]OJZ65745.1 hydrolase [Mycolicibacterium diernhoferi]OPE45233.1 hydrolase [Mycolicibacterium diernhoferi]PEG56103.1 hydrolase [Mycolicibacterium diernhoferi]QYL22419.1 zinc-dependent metalloprotease [Mycolicibacterium diernhoferi]
MSGTSPGGLERGDRGNNLSVGGAVDWSFAAGVGAKLSRPAPPTTDYTRDQAIAELAESARAAELPVREVTHLNEGAEVPEARIIDRPQWVHAATESMKVMTGGGESSSKGPAAGLAAKVAGAQTGAVLAFISSGILGQYDPFAGGLGDRRGELLLVYPNVIAVERQLRVKPADFRLWVCLHEVTHRVQFRANPWLADHMSDSLAALTDDAGEQVGEVIGRLGEYVRAQRKGEASEANSSGVIGLLRAVQAEPQRQALDRLLVLGTLLEGHAEHVMDAVGPAVVPTVATIRRRFDDRRQRKQPPLQRIIRTLLGFDAKLNQYTRGKVFVDEVVGRVGMHRFNTIWTNAETLPLPAEIEEPQRWIDRVL